MPCCPLRITVVLLLTGLQLQGGEIRPSSKFDLVVYGGTSGGVMAAVQAAKMGRRVVLIEPTNRIGGLTTCGLGWTDSGNKAVIGGLARTYYRQIKAHYDSELNWTRERRDGYSRYRSQDDAMWAFEPHVALATMEQTLEKLQVKVLLQKRLDRSSPSAGVRRDGRRLTAIVLESGDVVAGRMFIDASYEGDLLAAAGISYTIGREANDKYQEGLNGVQRGANTHNHRFVVNVDPFVRQGDPSSGLLPGIEPAISDDGNGDHRIQAYCFRMCLSNHPNNRVPFVKPVGYDALRYELLLRNFEAGDHRLPLKNDMMPNRKTDTNNNCAVSTDNIGMNYDYPEASYERREQIFSEHLRYQQGLMWTLANHPRVPKSIRNTMSSWGMAADEFKDSGHWPPQMYVREARRMVGVYVMSQHDCTRLRRCKDPIGIGSYNMDSHNAQRFVTKTGHVQNEGDVQVSPGGSYLISYRAIIPHKKEARNLLAPVALSASHIAYGSIRMEPVFMILGQSAATAAVIALDKDLDVQDVPYTQLRQQLLADQQVLDLPPGQVAKKMLLSASLPGVVVDDVDAEQSPGWSVSGATNGYVGHGYLHDGNAGKGRGTVRFVAKLEPGKYEVRFAYPPHQNRATNVPLTIIHSEGKTQVLVNQRQPPSKATAPFISLGVFHFERHAEVIVKNQGTDGYVVVDCLQFLPQD